MLVDSQQPTANRHKLSNATQHYDARHTIAHIGPTYLSALTISITPIAFIYQIPTKLYSFSIIFRLNDYNEYIARIYYNYHWIMTSYETNESVYRSFHSFVALISVGIRRNIKLHLHYMIVDVNEAKVGSQSSRTLIQILRRLSLILFEVVLVLTSFNEWS